jgi:hypothetical protein
VRRDVDRLLRDGCRTLDAVVVWQALPTVLYSVHLGVWTELLCGRLHTVPEDSARFWRRWIRPEFPGDGSAELAASELRAHVGPLVAEDHRSGQRLVALLDIAGPTILMMTERALRAFEDGIRGPNGRGIVEFESGLAKTTFVRGRRSPRRRGVRIE